MGEETNPTKDFLWVLNKARTMKATFPDMVIRVHAGENSRFPENVKDAIVAGATRIGHGIYGITPEVAGLAKEKNVIIELNFNSNLALGNVNSLDPLAAAAKRYLDAGTQLTFGTDGHGIYSTSPLSEYAVARKVGFSDENFLAVRATDEAYVAKMMASDGQRQQRDFCKGVNP
jgi:adenosine deaminase